MSVAVIALTYVHPCFSTETSVLSDVDYVLCLDSIANTDQLYLHVSKPPKEGTPAFAIVEVQCKLVLNLLHQHTTHVVTVHVIVK